MRLIDEFLKMYDFDRLYNPYICGLTYRRGPVKTFRASQQLKCYEATCLMIRNAYRALLKLRFRLKRRGLARFQVMAWVTEGFHMQDG